MKLLFLATVMTGIVAMALKEIIERFILHNAPKAEIELLFGNLPLIAGSRRGGVFIMYAGLRRSPVNNHGPRRRDKTGYLDRLGPGSVLAVPWVLEVGGDHFLWAEAGVSKASAEESVLRWPSFSPPVVMREVMSPLAARQAGLGAGHSFSCSCPACSVSCAASLQVFWRCDG